MTTAMISTITAMVLTNTPTPTITTIHSHS